MNKSASEKYNLYIKAKEAYYNGNPIMEDFEFDALEKELGLENNSFVGTKHNPSYTIKHPFIMGSLSKVQIHEKDGNIDWNKHYSEVYSYIYRNSPFDSNVIITPKYDGCSFEAIINNGTIVSISTRGDGEYGKNIKDHIEHLVLAAIANLSNDYEFCLRGEVLINKDIFEKKYSEFVNPRSFVAGILNRKFNDTSTEELKEYCKDLSIIIYDIHVNEEGNWIDVDWTVFKQDLYNSCYGYIYNGYLPMFYYIDENIEGPVDLSNIYNDFSNYRKVCPFALDGIVIKPESFNRINNLIDARPKDCVAVKFIPMFEETEIVDIQWKVGKTGEYAPVVITKPVIMDGNTVTKASGHNYGYLLDNKLSIGSKIILSLAGDIIPFIYKITNTDNFDDEKMNVPENTYVEGCHLMAIFDDNEITHLKFKNSALTLNIPNIGPAEIENIWNYLNKDNGETDEFFADDMFNFDTSSLTNTLPNNILLITAEDVYFGVVDGTKNGATGKANKIKKAFSDIIRNITLKDIIKSCNFNSCGDKVAEQCANYLVYGVADFTHLASKGYEWCLNENNCGENGPTENLQQVLNILASLGKTFEDFKVDIPVDIANYNYLIPVILTGEPNNYKSKGEFLSCHPEYRLTGKWTEVQIVFTNSLDSNTGKMKKAREKGIEIKLY